jgi:hypothetical protein
MKRKDQRSMLMLAIVMAFVVGRSRYAAEKHQQFSFYPCGSGFPTAKNRGKMPLTQYLETNPSA